MYRNRATESPAEIVVGQYARRQTLFRYATMRHQNHVLKLSRQFFQMMRDQQRRHVGPSPRANIKCGQQGFACEQVQTRSRLVENQQFRSRRQCPRQERPALFARRQNPEPVIRSIGQPDLLGGFASSLFLCGSRFIEVETEMSKETGLNDFENGQPGVRRERSAGVDNSDSPTEGIDIGLAEGFTENADGAVGRKPIAAQNAKQRALAATVGTDDCRPRTGGQGKVDIVEDALAVDGEADLAEFNGRC